MKKKQSNDPRREERKQKKNKEHFIHIGPKLEAADVFEKEIAKTLGIVQKDYQRKSFEGRQCSMPMLYTFA